MILSLGIGALIAWWLKPCKKSGACADAEPSPLPAAHVSTRENITVVSAPYVPPPDLRWVPPVSYNYSPPLKASAPVSAPAPVPTPVVIPSRPAPSYNYSPPLKASAPVPAPAPVPVPVVIPTRAPTYNYVPPVPAPLPSYNYVPAIVAAPSYNYVPSAPNPRHASILISPEQGGSNIYATYNDASGGYDTSVAQDDPSYVRGYAVRPYSVPGRPDGELLIVVKQNGSWFWD